MKTRYYLFGGQPVVPAYRWKGYSLPGLTRNASETRGLSGLGHDPETEFLPYRSSGPEPMDHLAGWWDENKTPLALSAVGILIILWANHRRDRKRA